MKFLALFWTGWKKVARKIGDFQARLILTIFYFVILGPISLVVRRSDPLGIKQKSPKGWIPKVPAEQEPMQRALQQS